jgi:alpha-D-xyloside xylohydrolase
VDKKAFFDVEEVKSMVIITTSRMKVVIDKATNAIIYTDIKGKLITSEYTISNKTMMRSNIARISTYNCETQFNSPADEALFHLGCHPEDSLSINYKRRNQEMLLKYMTGAIPVLLSTKGYGLLSDNYFASYFYGAEGEVTRFKYVAESGRLLDHYFFTDQHLTILLIYIRTTGKTPMYPKWSFGLFQSQDLYKTQQEILDVKDGYRNNHIPVDAVVQDWYWWSPLPIGSQKITPIQLLV